MLSSFYHYNSLLSRSQHVFIRFIHQTSRSSGSDGKLRGPTPQDITHFRSLLSQPDRSVVTDDISHYNKDWTGHYVGSSSLVLRPRSTQEVSSILKYCNKNLIGVVPQGGNTGLCGGATPMQDEVILSLERMKTIHGIDKMSGILTCDAGVVLENLHSYAKSHNFLFPLDIGSKGTCQIGGNVSTNAGGQYFFRFGSLHATVMGMEVCLADGRILHLNISDDDDNAKRCGTNRKDNTGYDLKHLFIGGEGTLGIITKVAIACPALPISRNAMLLVCNSYENDVLELLQCAKKNLGEILSAVELMDYNTLECVQKHGLVGDCSASQLLKDLLDTPTQEQSSSTNSPLFILVETQGSHLENDTTTMDSFITQLFDNGTVQNGFVAQDNKQILEMWSIRESCNPCVSAEGCCYKFDVSIPVDEYMDVAYEVENKLQQEESSVGDVRVCVWGHLADGNAHINVVTPGRYTKDINLAKRIETIVYGSVVSRKGSISAEHGLGQAKNEYLGQIKEKNTMDIMKQIRSTLDPHGIMNPNKYLPR